MLARVEGYGQHTVHAGVDHRLSDNLTLFAEYYSESATSGITAKREGLDRFDTATSGGRALALGMRFDF